MHTTVLAWLYLRSCSTGLCLKTIQGGVPRLRLLGAVPLLRFLEIAQTIGVDSRKSPPPAVAAGLGGLWVVESHVEMSACRQDGIDNVGQLRRESVAPLLGDSEKAIEEDLHRCPNRTCHFRRTYAKR